LLLEGIFHNKTALDKSDLLIQEKPSWLALDFKSETQ